MKSVINIDESDLGEKKKNFAGKLSRYVITSFAARVIRERATLCVNVKKLQ